MTLKTRSGPEAAEADYLSTIPVGRAVNPWEVLGRFASCPVVLGAITIAPRGARTGRLEERGAWIHSLWATVLTQMPTLHGCRMGWSDVFFMTDQTDVEEVQALFQTILASLCAPDLESRCILAPAEAGQVERGHLLGEMQHDLTATDVGGSVRFPHRLRDGTSWPGK